MNAVTHLHAYHQPIDLPFELPTKIYGAMLVLWLLRPDLKCRFPLHKDNPRTYLKFLSWCVFFGRKEYAILRDIDAWNEELLKPIKLPDLKEAEVWEPVYNVGMYLMGLYRAKYWNAKLLTSAQYRTRTARYYFREGRQSIGLNDVPPWQLSALHKQFGSFEAFYEKIKLPTDGLNRQFELRRLNQDIALAWHEVDSTSLPEPTPAPQSRPLSMFLSRYTSMDRNKLFRWWPKSVKPTITEITGVAERISNQGMALPRDANHPFGVNLYGYARGELGIGEDVRMMALALQAADVPFCIINIELGAQVSQHDRSADHWISNQPVYSINLFCMTGLEMARYICNHGQKVLGNRYTIGLWPWELPQWPRAWHHAWSLVDEIWGISHYTASAYRDAPVPVHPMPLPVILGDVSPIPRAQWGLPENTYLFVFAFDMNSMLSRKNPIGLIDAFHMAFPDKADTSVGLVLKVNHLDTSKPEWRRIAEHIDNDPRIRLIGESLRKPDVLALYKVCDCVVSLHRSEGFGRMLAEAQLMGKPLITTGYSGNVDFCAKPPTLSIGYKEKALQANEYFFGEGQHWADPDLNEAAVAMRRCANEPQYREQQNYEVEQFSPEYCGQRFKTRLTEIISRLDA